ncbi:MAG: hypothetical protein QMD12_01560, partial [Candidatus Aenigmarchaeota archaeon]|nr:hypothetical protein [Candidatus Aenigmarchaeota archaeon]
MLWKKKEKEKKAEKRICGCELCRLSARLDEKIVGKQDREMVSPLVISPSTVKETDPMKKLEEAKKLEERGNVGGAARSYRRAA